MIIRLLVLLFGLFICNVAQAQSYPCVTGCVGSLATSNASAYSTITTQGYAAAGDGYGATYTKWTDTSYSAVNSYFYVSDSASNKFIVASSPIKPEMLGADNTGTNFRTTAYN
jgi:hypothetical protein